MNLRSKWVSSNAGRCGLTEYRSGGFDLRIRVELLADDPSLERQWLLPANRNRISTDAMVWPMPEEVSRFYLETPRSYPLGCLKDYDELLSALRDRGVATANYTPICLTISDATIAALSSSGWADHFSEAPSMKDLIAWGWRFWGFDVAELNGLCSGLKGCGYDEPSWSGLRARFGGALNDVGLFQDPAIAAEFAQIRGLEIPSHAPFEIVGILTHRAR